MQLSPEILNIQRKTKSVFRRHGVNRAAVFGSFARGESRRSSDIDLLVTVKPMGLFAFVGLQRDLEKNLGRKVDLTTHKALHPIIRKQILDEQIVIYEKKKS